MQLGMIGLGRMGGNMVRRLLKGGDQCVVYNRSANAVAELVKEKARHCWRAVQPILDTWANNPPRHFPNYFAGSDGPAAADELLARDGRAWRPLD
jgi:hypothetical protein